MDDFDFFGGRGYGYGRRRPITKKGQRASD